MSNRLLQSPINRTVVEAYRLDRYDNFIGVILNQIIVVVEAYRLDRYDNSLRLTLRLRLLVVEAYRLDRYDNSKMTKAIMPPTSCRSLSFG